MALLDGDESVYEFENDERLSVEAKVALGMLRETHVTIRYFLRLLADTLGPDLALKAQEFAHDVELARMKQHTTHTSCTQALTTTTKTADTANVGDTKKNEPKPKPAPVSKSDKNVSKVSKTPLASKNSSAPSSERQGSSKR